MSSCGLLQAKEAHGAALETMLDLAQLADSGACEDDGYWVSRPWLT